MTGSDLANLSVGDSKPPLVVKDLDRLDFVRYAGASGDFNPMHVVEPKAVDAGYRSVFGPGMLTASIVSSYLVDWFGIRHVSRFRTRFISRLWPGDTITVVGEISEKSVKEKYTSYEVDFVAENQDSDTLITGDATIVV